MVSPDFDIRPSILVGDTADVFLHRTLSILRAEGVNPYVGMEFSPSRAGIFCGLPEVRSLLQKVLPETGVEVWALEEGEAMEAGEVALRINAPYSTFGLYETALCGTLASCSGWATAARECVDAANGLPVLAMGARHVHPNSAAVLDYSAVTGGCTSCSTMQGGRLARVTPSGTMPHVLPLLLGDTLSAIEAFDRRMPSEIPRIALVDTFRDEAEEAVRVAGVLKDRLRGIMIDTAKGARRHKRGARARGEGTAGPGRPPPRGDLRKRRIHCGEDTQVRGGQSACARVRCGGVHLQRTAEQLHGRYSRNRRPASGEAWPDTRSDHQRPS